jgi:hypothetical protein
VGVAVAWFRGAGWAFTVECHGREGGGGGGGGGGKAKGDETTGALATKSSGQHARGNGTFLEKQHGLPVGVNVMRGVSALLWL